jgi:hypothetical protein
MKLHPFIKRCGCCGSLQVVWTICLVWIAAGCASFRVTINQTSYYVENPDINQAAVRELVDSVATQYGFRTDVRPHTPNYIATYRLDESRRPIWLRAFVQKATDGIGQADLINLPELAKRLRAPSPSDAVSQYISGRLSAETKQLLTSDLGKESSELLRKALISDFISIIMQDAFSAPDAPHFYDRERFASMQLSPETQQLLSRNPQGQYRGRLDRLLLHDAYPLEIAESNEKDEIVVHLSQRDYSVRTTALYKKIERTLTDSMKERFAEKVRVGTESWRKPIF